MLKPVDILVGLKIITSEKNWTQMSLASKLYLATSQVHAALKQLVDSGLFGVRDNRPYPIFAAIEEYLLSGLKYSFPVKTGELTIGIPTAYAAEPLCHEIDSGKDPVPVWPYSGGTKRGVALEALHKNIPRALTDFPDPALKELLALIDALRIGRARERTLAKKLLKSKLDELLKIREDVNE